MQSEDPGIGRQTGWPRGVTVLVASSGALSLIGAVIIWARSGPGGALSLAVMGIMLLSLALQGALRKPTPDGGRRRPWRGQSPGFVLASTIAWLTALALIVVSVKGLV